VEEGWKVDVGALTRGQDITQSIPMFIAIARTSKEVAGEIDAGKYDSITAVQAALQQKVIERMIQANATTAPATTRSAI
jgi:hypothetical protein